MKLKGFSKYFIIIGIFLGLIFVFFWFLNRPIEVSYINPVREDFIESVLGSGRIIPKDYVSIAPEVTSRIIELNIEEGDKVSSGNLIASLDSKNLDNRVMEINASINSANLNYESIISTNYDLAVKERMRLEIELEQLRREKDKYEILFNEGAIPEIELTKLRDQFAVLQTRLKSAKITEVSLSASGTEAKKALSAVSQNIATLNSTKSEYQNYSITSPISGTVVRLFASKGELAKTGQIIAEIADISEKSAYIQVDERNITKISLGQKAYIYPSSNPNLVVESFVSEISNLVDRETGTVSVKIRIPQDSLDLFLIDLTVIVELILNEMSDVLVINSSYIISENGKDYVLIEDGGIAKKIEIVSKGNGSKRVVMQNLAESSKILDPQEVNENDKIRLKGEL